MQSIIIIQPLLALLTGLLILFVPRFLNFAVAAFLIVFGLVGLMAHYGVGVAAL